MSVTASWKSRYSTCFGLSVCCRPEGGPASKCFVFLTLETHLYWLLVLCFWWTVSFWYISLIWSTSSDTQCHYIYIQGMKKWFRCLSNISSKSRVTAGAATLANLLVCHEFAAGAFFNSMYCLNWKYDDNLGTVVHQKKCNRVSKSIDVTGLANPMLTESALAWHSLLWITCFCLNESIYIYKYMSYHMICEC